MEIGSFIELQFPRGKEFYSGSDICRLNSGRAAIYHAVKSLDCSVVYLPVYQCGTVREFLVKKGLTVKYYNMDTSFLPLLDHVEDEAAVLIVNYFGIFSHEEMAHRAAKYPRVVVDNCPAFYASPIEKAMNVYSARKFFGVPDGAYVVGNGANQGCDYPQDYSSDTSLFLLKRIEYGCEGEVYKERELNEARLDNTDVRLMSKLTHTILDGVDYEAVKAQRRANFEYACLLFEGINQLDVKKFYDDSCVPMVYPLMTEDSTLIRRLLNGKHFQGNWWRYILDLPYANEFEKTLSSRMVPITIDQRYGKEELNYISNIVYEEENISIRPASR